MARPRAASLRGGRRDFGLALAAGALELGYPARVVAAWLAGEAGLTAGVADGLVRAAASELKIRRRAAAIERHGALFAARVDAGIAAIRGRKAHSQMATPFSPREALAGATHVAAAIQADTDGIRTALRAAARTACTAAGLINVPAERLEQIAALGVATAIGPLPERPR